MMTIILRFFRTLGFPIVALVIPLAGQSHTTHWRLSELIVQQTQEMPMSATRFMPVFSFRGIGEWSSPRSVISIGDIPFSVFPLGQATADLLPFSTLLFDSVTVESRPTVSSTSSAAGGTMEVHRASIPNDLAVQGLFMTGSETGDRVIHMYTRKLAGYWNKNKVGPSGMLSVSNRTGSFAYRVSGTGVAYFLTGGSVDPIIGRLDSKNAWEQNRHYLGSAELEYREGKTTYELIAGLSNVSGWEFFPFASTFVRSESRSSAFLVHVRDLLPGFTFSTFHHAIHSVTFTHLGTRPGEVRQNEISGVVRWKDSVSHSSAVEVTGRIALASANPTNSSNGQILSKSHREVVWGLAAEVEHRLLERTRAQIVIRVDRASELTMASGHLSIRHQASDLLALEVGGNSIATAPGLYDRYGRFATSRERIEGGVEEFTVSGNPSLKFERTEDLTLTIEGRTSDRRFAGSLTPFFQQVSSPISQIASAAVRSRFPGDIVRSATYENLPSKFSSGVSMNLKRDVTSEINLIGSYRWLENTQIPRAPRHLGSLQVSVTLESKTSIMFSVEGWSRMTFREFIVDPAQDDLNGTGTSGTIHGGMSVDITVRQHFGNFFSLRTVMAQVEILNLFNRSKQYLPVGNSLGTTFLFTLKVIL